MRRSITDMTVIKAYGEGLFKVTICKHIRIGPMTPDELAKRKRREGGIKLEPNIQRAKERVRALALCNNWDWFVTLTIDKEKCGRYDLKEYYKRFRNWLRSYSNYHGIKIDYVFIPEQHTDGAWHLHGFMLGIPIEHMRNFTLQDKLPYRLRERLLQGVDVYEWLPYRDKFGFTELERIQNKRGAAWYIQKYITKDLTRVVQEYNAHLYYCSKGLRRPTEMARGWTVPFDQLEADYSSDYAAVRWVSGKNAKDMAYMNSLLTRLNHSMMREICTST